MVEIRTNMFQISYSELGKPKYKGYCTVPGESRELLLDEADMRYIEEYIGKGYEPSFFIKPSKSIRNAFIVVARQRL